MLMMLLKMSKSLLESDVSVIGDLELFCVITCLGHFYIILLFRVSSSSGSRRCRNEKRDSEVMGEGF
jgi:hypothetical protein